MPKGDGEDSGASTAKSGNYKKNQDVWWKRQFTLLSMENRTAWSTWPTLHHGEEGSFDLDEIRLHLEEKRMDAQNNIAMRRLLLEDKRASNKKKREKEQVEKR